MPPSPNSISSLESVTDIMRELSCLTDPDDSAELFGSGIRTLNIAPRDRYVGISRRDLSAPQFRITRCSDWKEHPNPWFERDKLPLLSGGLLADIIYANQPAIIPDLPSRLTPADPAYQYLKDMQLLVALPSFDNGDSLNVGLLLSKKGGAADNYPIDSIPIMVWVANLWGRATLNLVTKQKLDAAYQSLDRELKVVGDLQKSLLPRHLPTIPNIDIAAHYQTSARAGGDYYGFFPLPDNKWGIFVADVSGHGTPAAVMMAITHAIAHAHPGLPTPPASMLRYLNTQLTHRYTADSGTFVTALYAVLDPIARTLTLASAGHPLPRILRNNIPLECSAETALPLGLSADEQYPEYTLQLQPNDKLLLYTDGIIESFGASGELFGIRRLDASAATRSPSATVLLLNVLADMREFTRGTPAQDDQTLLAFVIE